MILSKTIRKNRQKILFVIILCFSLFLIFFNPFYEKTSTLLNSSFSQALVVFGSSKALNAIISLAQGTQIDFPFFTLAIGEILDPINDLVEQFSFVMLLSLISFGIQKILLNFIDNSFYNLFFIFSIVLYIACFLLKNKKYEKLKIFFFKLSLLIAFLKFSLPIFTYINEITYTYFIKPSYNVEKLNENILIIKDNISKVTQDSINKKEEGFFDKFTKKLRREYYENKIEEYRKVADKSSDYIISLIIVFVFQSIILPLVFLFVFYIIMKNIILLK